MQKLRNKIQEKKAELKLDNAELGLAIGRGERYIDRLLRDAVSTAKQEEVTGLLDGLDCSRVAAKLQMQSYLTEKSLAYKSAEIENLKDQYKAKNIQVEGLLKDADELEKMHNDERNKLIARAENATEQIDRSAKQLAASVDQNEKLKEQIKNTAMQLTNVELDNKELQGTADNALKNILECRESASKKIQELESSLDQTGGALRFMKIMCIVLALICAVIISTSVFR